MYEYQITIQTLQAITMGRTAAGYPVMARTLDDALDAAEDRARRARYDSGVTLVLEAARGPYCRTRKVTV